MAKVLDFIGWNNPTRRAAYVRFGVAIVGYLIHNGTITVPAWLWEAFNDPGLATMGGALLINAGEKNATK